jgi:hypothetical protein
LPPPQNVTHGNLTALIDPCFFNITSEVSSPSIAQNDLPVQTIHDNIINVAKRTAWYKGTDCFNQKSELSDANGQILNLNVKITN